MTSSPKVVEPMSREIACCRLLLSTVALGLLLFGNWPALQAGRSLDPGLAIVAGHLAFALASLLCAANDRLRPAIATVAPWLDAGFAAVLAVATSGTRSPFFAFMAFAIVAAAFDGHSRRTLRIALVCVAFYFGLVLVDQHAKTELVVMRAVYLSILSYLVIRLAARRFRLEDDLRMHESAVQRQHFAREIHDGCAQLLAALDVRLEANRAFIGAGRTDDALADLARLRESVHREQQDLRRFARRLSAAETGPDTSAHPASTTRLSLDLQCNGSPDVVAQVLAMIREALHNVDRHARAASATVRARVIGTEITVDIEDDGVGFESDARPPWTIASRVAELGGLLRMRRGTVGAQLSISVPKA